MLPSHTPLLSTSSIAASSTAPALAPTSSDRQCPCDLCRWPPPLPRRHPVCRCPLPRPGCRFVPAEEDQLALIRQLCDHLMCLRRYALFEARQPSNPDCLIRINVVSPRGGWGAVSHAYPIAEFRWRFIRTTALRWISPKNFVVVEHSLCGSMPTPTSAAPPLVPPFLWVLLHPSVFLSGNACLDPTYGAIDIAQDMDPGGVFQRAQGLGPRPCSLLCRHVGTDLSPEMGLYPSTPPP